VGVIEAGGGEGGEGGGGRRVETGLVEKYVVLPLLSAFERWVVEYQNGLVMHEGECPFIRVT